MLTLFQELYSQTKQTRLASSPLSALVMSGVPVLETIVLGIVSSVVRINSEHVIVKFREELD